ncbi:MAG TPA: IS200/IS605 family transposase [Flavobacteriales bacterium]|nr:IS200/IS605 family transposase [Flavobacteriales bacterium]
MSHSYTKIWIHAIWATKLRAPLIQSKFESQLHQFIRDQLRELGCPVRIINGMPDHIHCLFLLSRDKSIADVIGHIKGRSSYYVNQQKWTNEAFAWQTGYAAFAVSQSVTERVFHYIRNQKEHHRKKTYYQEYSAFLNIHGISTP